MDRPSLKLTVRSPTIFSTRPKKYRNRFCRWMEVSVLRFKAHSLKMLAELGTSSVPAVHSTAAQGTLLFSSLQYRQLFLHLVKLLVTGVDRSVKSLSGRPTKSEYLLQEPREKCLKGGRIGLERWWVYPQWWRWLMVTPTQSSTRASHCKTEKVRPRMHFMSTAMTNTCA